MRPQRSVSASRRADQELLFAEPSQRSADGYDEEDDGIVFTVPACGAVVLMVLGTIMGYHFLHMTTLNGYTAVLHMIEGATADNLYIEELMLAVGGFAIGVALTGLVGYIGAKTMTKRLVCLYLVSCFLLASFSFFMFCYMAWLASAMGPAIIEKGDDLCNVTKHAMYSVMLDCPFALQKTAAELRADCDEQCQATVDELKLMRGCKLLNVLCHSFDYTDMGNGDCLTRSRINDAVGQPVMTDPVVRTTTKHPTEHCCREACDAAILCRGYVFDQLAGTCKLLSPTLPWVNLDLAAAEQAAEELTTQQAIQRTPSNSKNDLRSELAKTGVRHCSSYTWDAPADLDTQWSEEIAEEERIYGSTGGDSTAICMRKDDETSAIQFLVTSGHMMIFSTALVFVALLLAGTCACFLQRLLISRKERRGGHVGLMKSMLCPFDYCQGDGLLDFGYEGGNERRYNKKRRRKGHDTDSETSGDDVSPGGRSRSSRSRSPSPKGASSSNKYLSDSD